MNVDNKCTLLLSSYDNGQDLWEGFFKALTIQWPELKMPIVINTETLSFSFDKLEIRAINAKSKDIPWGKRLKDTLKKINTEYVLLFLEDYWLDDRVKNDEFMKVLNWMEKNPNVATVSFYPCMPGHNIDDGRLEGFELRPEKCEYKINCQVALWRKSCLQKYLRNHESPWEFEIYGSQRAARYKERFYTFKTYDNLIFSYGDPEVGCVVHKGKWVKEAACALAEKYDLNIDFSIRGFENFEEYASNSTQKKYCKLRIMLHEIKLWIRKILSLI